jgi:hypothetical protein
MKRQAAGHGECSHVAIKIHAPKVGCATEGVVCVLRRYVVKEDPAKMIDMCVRTASVYQEAVQIDRTQWAIVWSKKAGMGGV